MPEGPHSMTEATLDPKGEKVEVVRLTLIFNETWDEKALRLMQEMRDLLLERPMSVLDGKAWKKWTPRYRDLDYEIYQHLHYPAPVEED